ncbi:MAG TPA: chlorohydrolase [Parabacteroides sp.]|nr:chlorohydrolase [Parabacteroides sp.]
MKDSILIKNAQMDMHPVDIFIEGNRIKKIGKGINGEASQTIDATGKAVIPGLINGHTHAAMTLFRGFADDMKLMPWLEERIWPNEAKLTQEDVYWGSKLACLEMIKSGTTTFLDMYQKFSATADAVEEMGIRGFLSPTCFDWFDPVQTEKGKQECERHYKQAEAYGPRVRYTVGPHAIYTVSGPFLQWIDRFAREKNVLIHLHLSETEGEVKNSIEKFGLSPVRYLYKLGVLSPRLVIAHGIYVDDDEIRMLADHDVKVVHNPASNLKLASGIRFKFKEMKDAGIKVGLGTDGCSSSNNLDMIETMKLASLIGKAWRKDPETLTAREMLDAATSVGADILGLDAGRLEEGALADLVLVDLKIPAFTPNFNFVSNLVYAANGSCVDTVICDGKVLMQGRKVPHEEEIMEEAARRAYDLMKR